MKQYTQATWDRQRWPNFSFAEMKCRHTGLCKVSPEFMDRLQELRHRLGKPLAVTSGYRDPTHPVEAAKDHPGTHALGQAVDLAVWGWNAMQLTSMALILGFTGIGLKQHGFHNKRFVHLDDIAPDSPYDHIVRPAFWTYGG